MTGDLPVPTTAAGEPINPAGLGVVIVDVQNDYCAPEGAVWRIAEERGALLHASGQIESLVRGFRAVPVPCFFIRSFMDDKYKLPALARRHRESGLAEICREGTWGAEFFRPTPGPSDFVITKHTPDSFLYTYLEPILRKFNVKTLVVCGFLTEVCVLETAKSALQRGFSVIVPEDCTAGIHSECSRVAIDELASRSVIILNLDQLLQHVDLMKIRMVNGKPVSRGLTSAVFDDNQLALEFEEVSRPVHES